MIFFFPGPVAGLVGVAFSMIKPIPWFWDAVKSMFSDMETLKKADALFDGADTDPKDGFLTRKELSDYAERNPWFRDAYELYFGITIDEALEALFTGADTNHDNRLSRKELHEFMLGQAWRVRWVKIATVATVCCMIVAFAVYSMRVTAPANSP